MLICLRNFQALIAIIVAITAGASAQTGLPIFTDLPVNGFTVHGSAKYNLTNTSPVHSGVHSISVLARPNQMISFSTDNHFNTYRGGLDDSLYSALTFWVNGGTSGGQVLQIYGEFGANHGAGPIIALTGLPVPKLLPNTWTQLRIPLNALEPPGMSNLNRINIELAAKGTAN